MMNKLILGLVTVSALGLFTVPAFAGEGNSGNYQESNQTNVVTGNGNTAVNRSTQVNQEIRSRSGGDSVNIQRSSQYNDVYGDNNTVVNESSQINQNIRTQGGAARIRANQR